MTLREDISELNIDYDTGLLKVRRLARTHTHSHKSILRLSYSSTAIQRIKYYRHSMLTEHVSIYQLLA